MSAGDRARHDYQLRLAKEAAEAEATAELDPDEEAKNRTRRQASQSAWVEIQIQRAISDGEFDNLPGAGKPIPGIDRPHDPNWWIKRLIERERISVLPPALALRTEDAGLDDELDRVTTPDGVRSRLEDFNARIVDARRQLQGGPPVITPLRDIDQEIDAWQRRRAERVAEQKQALAAIRAAERSAASPPWWRRIGRRP